MASITGVVTEPARQKLTPRAHSPQMLALAHGGTIMGRCLIVAVALATASLSAATAAQHADHAASRATPRQLGTVDFPNSGNAAAQGPFLEGVKLLHNFHYEAAADAFRRAQSADPDFLLAYWGEAMSHNQTLWSNQDRNAALKVLAKFAPTRQARAAKAKTDRERAWLDAVETLYGDGTKFDRDVAYADKMDALAEAYPDTEAIAFAALAALGRSHGTRNAANYERAGAMLEPLFTTHPNHPGIVHYIIHSYDDPTNAAKGLAAARAYDRLAPDSHHAQHMTSHIFLALGLWPDVERANLQARAAIEREAGKPVPEAACGHYANWLVYARLQQGKSVTRDVEACAAAVKPHLSQPGATKVVVGSAGRSSSHSDMRARNFIETGEMAEPLPLPEGELYEARFNYHYADVLAARHNAAKAVAAIARLRADHAVIAANFAKENPDDDQSMPWFDLALAQAEAVVQLAQERQAEGIAALKAVAEREKAMPPAFGPPTLPKPTWELLGDELLAVGDRAGAAAAYRESLRLQPGRRLSLAGLAEASD